MPRATPPATPKPTPARRRGAWWLRWLGWTLLAGLSLQAWFALRVGVLAWVDAPSTTFQRTEAWRLARTGELGRWRHQGVPTERLSPQLMRAVIASEDSGFTEHFGVDWQAMQSAWQRNQRQWQQAARRAGDGPVRPARLAGGSTITQQLAKNLLLSGERTLLRKGQELLITWMLEAMLDKRRILTVYLNSVEWGDGLFGAEAAARHYARKSAAQLNAAEAARLAVLLPAPKRYGRRPDSAYLSGRAQTVLARMPAVRLP
ncbi:monofunctional biosynthetic peptidoglycan transglycosylase [Tepidimonas ignava]|uniref:Biosynthetic peptidoglycan transglycosylase n=1 Tax=Tepidimonas ignava TaxID=114249 RepID=A0A4R3LIM3_9BURK|nr:monofunctional biosynthetic peptidoglycan transglycosylase [Tepidimonas ignava]TCS97446.1 monofunctional biosynthetic peptidoglycan transglycosylase [Tepidimonas ignava]TSE22161.1 Biosynthetic peptidoglycan transglycosylase [Tepidimonas ignava]